MAEETTQEVTLTPQEQVDLLKANTVSKEQFDNLQAQYNTLFKAYTERPATINQEDKELSPIEQRKQDEKDFEKTREEFTKCYQGRHSNQSDYEMTEMMLKADDYMRKYYDKSIFESETGSTPEERTAIDKGVELMRYALEKSDGDPNVFKTVFRDRLI